MQGNCASPYIIAIGNNDDANIVGQSWYTCGLGHGAVRGCYVLQSFPNRLTWLNEHTPMGFKPPVSLHRYRGVQPDWSPLLWSLRWAAQEPQRFALTEMAVAFSGPLHLVTTGGRIVLVEAGDRLAR
jgi:hypothetical protein